MIRAKVLTTLAAAHTAAWTAISLDGTEHSEGAWQKVEDLIAELVILTWGSGEPQALRPVQWSDE